MLENYSEKYDAQFHICFLQKFTFLLLLLTTFQISAQQLQEKNKIYVHNQEDTKTLSRIVTKNSSNSDLQGIVNIFKKNNVKVVFSKIRRNVNYEIIQLKVVVSYDKDKLLEFSTKNNAVINDFTIEGLFENGKIKEFFFGTPKDEGLTIQMKKKFLENDSDDILAYQNDHNKQVYNASKYNDVVFVLTNNESNDNKTIILQKEDLKNSETKSGIEIVTDLLKNENLNLETAHLKLNQKDVKLADLNQINNKDEIVIILSNENALNEDANNQKKTSIEIFQDKELLNQLKAYEDVNEALNMLKEAKMESSKNEKRTFKVVMKAEKKSNVSYKNNEYESSKKISIEEEKIENNDSDNVSLSQPKVTYENGRKVTINQISIKSGYIVKSTTTNSELASYKKYLKDENIIFEYKNLTRNKFGLITGLEIEIASGNKKTSAIWETAANEKGIPNIFVGRINGELSVVEIE